MTRSSKWKRFKVPYDVSVYLIVIFVGKLLGDGNGFNKGDYCDNESIWKELDELLNGEGGNGGSGEAVGHLSNKGKVQVGVGGNEEGDDSVQDKDNQ